MKKIQGMTGSYTNATICLPRYPGAPSKGLGWRTCWARLRGLERHGCPGLLLWSPFSWGQGHTAATMLPYSCLGKGVEPRGKWVPWNSLGEGSMGRRKEREHGGNGLLAVQMQSMFLSFHDFRASHCGHLKQEVAWGRAARLWLLLLGSGWHLPLSPNRGHILVRRTLVHMFSAPHKAWPWS